MPLATKVAVTLSVPVGRFSDVTATPFVRAAETAALGVELPATV